MKIIGSFPKTRLRRLRKSKWLRDLVSENNISSKDLILPVFVCEKILLKTSNQCQG